MGFEEYWYEYGELHASMCNGDIKTFAKQIWLSASRGSDELRAKLDRIADIANAEKEVAIMCRAPGIAFGFDKIIKECE